MHLPEPRLQYTHNHQINIPLLDLAAFGLEPVNCILKQTQLGYTMVFKNILGRVFGCLRPKRKSLRGDNIQSQDHNVAANETLSESDSISVYSVYIADSVSAASEASESITFEDCWSYAESVELVRSYYFTIVYSPVDTSLLYLSC
jgi:hypothetical protein